MYLCNSMQSNFTSNLLRLNASIRAIFYINISTGKEKTEQRENQSWMEVKARESRFYSRLLQRGAETSV